MSAGPPRSVMSSVMPPISSSQLAPRIVRSSPSSSSRTRNSRKSFQIIQSSPRLLRGPSIQRVLVEYYSPSSARPRNSIDAGRTLVLATYIAQRLAQTVPVLFLVTVGVFLIVQLIPGDPVLVMLGADAGANVNREQYE